MARKGTRTKTNANTTNQTSDEEIVPESDQEDNGFLVLPKSRPMLMEVLIETKPQPAVRKAHRQVKVVIQSRRRQQLKPIPSISTTVCSNPVQPNAVQHREAPAIRPEKGKGKKVFPEHHAEQVETRIHTYQSSDATAEHEMVLPIIRKQNSTNSSPHVFRDITDSNLHPMKFKLTPTSRTNILPLPLAVNTDAKTPTGPSHQLGPLPSIKYQVPKTLLVQDGTPVVQRGTDKRRSSRERSGLGLHFSPGFKSSQERPLTKGKGKMPELNPDYNPESSLPPSSPPSSTYAYNGQKDNKKAALFAEDHTSQFHQSHDMQEHEMHPWNIHAGGDDPFSEPIHPSSRSRIQTKDEYSPQHLGDDDGQVVPQKRLRKKATMENLDPSLAPTAEDPFGFFALEKKLKEQRTANQKSDQVQESGSDVEEEEMLAVTSSATRKRKREELEPSSPTLNSTFLSLSSSLGHGLSDRVVDSPSPVASPKANKRQKPQKKKGFDNSDPLALALSLEALLPRRVGGRKRSERERPVRRKGKGKRKASSSDDDDDQEGAISDIKDQTEPEEEFTSKGKLKSRAKVKRNRLRAKSTESGEDEEDEEMALARAERIAYFEKLRQYKVTSENVYVV